MERIFIVSAKRTPQGAFLGSLAKRSAVDLAITAGRAVLENVDPAKIDQVIVGNVLSAGQGMNIARQIGVGLNVPLDRIAYSVNMMCASGMQSIMLAAQAIRAGEAATVLCGGTESMSRAPYLLERARGGYKLGDGVLVDDVLRDGLTDTFSNQHMGLTAELLAEEFGISRQQQDEFAAASQQKYATAHANGEFADEIVAMEELEHDEHPRPDTTAEKLSKLRPAFKRDGSVTAGNASGINDGAAMLVVCGESALKDNGWSAVAEITAWASIGCDPQKMGLGPVYATRRLCERSGVKVEDFDSIELNEAFASQSIACINELGLDISKVNPDGGAIAMGHPIGASGARIVTHLANQIAAGKVKKGLATLCVGGGMGAAIAVEKI